LTPSGFDTRLRLSPDLVIVGNGQEAPSVNSFVNPLSNAQHTATTTSSLPRLSVSEAVTALQKGHLVALPTETVYGLAADAQNDDAINTVFALKGRPSNHPVIVHIAHPHHISDWAVEIPDITWELTEAFWPGPLTLILKRHPKISPLITGGQDTVAIRMPQHPMMLDVISGLGHGIVAPSANRFGHISPTLPTHVDAEFSEHPRDSLTGLVDGGPCRVGIESTILDISDMLKQGPIIRRPGHITGRHLSRVHASLSSLIHSGASPPNAHNTPAPRTPGNLESHYAPICPTKLVWSEHLTALVASPSLNIGFLGWSQAPKGCQQVITLPATPDSAAEALYCALRELEAHCDEIWIEALPVNLDATVPPEWAGVWDRLLKATGGQYKLSE
jgi:L-threonylcarbamoyladenylate synthase